MGNSRCKWLGCRRKRSVALKMSSSSLRSETAAGNSIKQLNALWCNKYAVWLYYISEKMFFLINLVVIFFTSWSPELQDRLLPTLTHPEATLSSRLFCAGRGRCTASFHWLTWQGTSVALIHPVLTAGHGWREQRSTRAYLHWRSASYRRKA